jgi:hypothetical protein
MEPVSTLSSLFLGVIIRIAVPVFITAVLIGLFSRLDAHWKAEAEKGASTHKTSLVYARNTGCWDIHNCPDDKKKKCRAYQNPDTPCWQVFRSREGLLKESCLNCQVFKDAPLPVYA